VKPHRGVAVDYLELCCVAPHPPIMVPEVGGRDAAGVEDSIRAMTRLADEIERINPETLIVMSPHSDLLADGFTVMTSPHLSGSFRSFGAASVVIESEPDMQLVDAIIEHAAEQGVPVRPLSSHRRRGAEEMDHGILVPLYFLSRKRYPLVCLSLSMLDYRDHYRLGMAVRDAVSKVGRKSVFVASGDMSHRLKPGAPAGYSPRGAEFDREIVDIMESGNFRRLFTLDPSLVYEAGECGLRSIITLAGTVDGLAVVNDVLSYEGPFGVGYMVARVVPGEEDPSRRLVSL